MYNKSVANTGHSSTKIPISTEIATKPSEEAVYKWTLTKDAVASCFNKDILEMKANENKGVLYAIFSKRCPTNRTRA
jgi:hypothetical protein